MKWMDSALPAVQDVQGPRHSGCWRSHSPSTSCSALESVRNKIENFGFWGSSDIPVIFRISGIRSVNSGGPVPVMGQG